jgi:hypothetical protein
MTFEGGSTLIIQSDGDRFLSDASSQPKTPESSATPR